MGISLKKEHLKRYKDVAALLLKYGNSEMVKNAGLEEMLVSEDKGKAVANPVPAYIDPLAGPTRAAPTATKKPVDELPADCVYTTEKPDEFAKPVRLPQGGYGYVVPKKQEGQNTLPAIPGTEEAVNGNGNFAKLLPALQSDVVEEPRGQFQLLDAGAQEAVSKKATPADFARDLEKLGPTFVKIGQLLSTRADFLPPAYLQALARLQDNCEPFPYADVERILSEELGVRLSKGFQHFDSEPLAAASLGQIHKAILRDGRKVAVKIQRPGIRETVIRDFEALADIASFYDHHTPAGKKYQFSTMLEELRKSLMEELDYRKEAHNLETLKVNMKEFELIEVPQPVTDYSTSKVLTMDFVDGKKITNISNFERLDLNGGPLAEEVFRAYLKQILLDGFFHADPHPGNVFLTHDNKVALLDLGMVARLTPYMQGKLFLLLLAISEGRADAVANISIDIGQPKDNFDESQFRARITSLIQGHLEKNLNEMDLGVVIVGVTQISGDCNIKVPAELTMLGKTLLNLDQVGTTLDPNFNPNDSMKKNAPRIMRERLEHSFSVGNIFAALVEAKDFIEKMPGTVHKIMDLIANNNLRMKVDAIDEAILVDAAQKIANRITLGLVLASLIMGASNLMKVETSFRLWGYPGLAIICFLLAASAGFVLIIHIAIHDQHGRKIPQQ